MARYAGQCVAVVSVPSHDRERQQNVTWRLGVLLDPPDERGSLLRVRWLKVTAGHKSSRGVTVVKTPDEGRILQHCILVHQIDLLSTDMQTRFPPNPVLSYQGTFRLLPRTVTQLEQYCKNASLKSDFTLASNQRRGALPDRRLEYTPVTCILQELLRLTSPEKDSVIDVASLHRSKAVLLERLNKEFAQCHDAQKLEDMRNEVCGKVDSNIGDVVAKACVGCTPELWTQAQALLVHLVPTVRTAEKFRNLQHHYSVLRRRAQQIEGVEDGDELIRVAEVIVRNNHSS